MNPRTRDGRRHGGRQTADRPPASDSATSLCCRRWSCSSSSAPIVSPVFLSQANITTILTSSAALALVVLGESLVIITGKFDLSLESTSGFAPAIGAMVVMPAANYGFGFELPTVVGMLVVLVVGALVGFVNGFMVVRLKLNAFIVTLAMLIILRGMLVGATSGRTLFDLPDAFYALMMVTFLGLPLAVWLAAVAFLIAG